MSFTNKKISKINKFLSWILIISFCLINKINNSISKEKLSINLNSAIRENIEAINKIEINNNNEEDPIENIIKEEKQLNENIQKEDHLLTLSIKDDFTKQTTDFYQKNKNVQAKIHDNGGNNELNLRLIKTNDETIKHLEAKKKALDEVQENLKELYIKGGDILTNLENFTMYHKKLDAINNSQNLDSLSILLKSIFGKNVNLDSLVAIINNDTHSNFVNDLSKVENPALACFVLTIIIQKHLENKAKAEKKKGMWKKIKNKFRRKKQFFSFNEIKTSLIKAFKEKSGQNGKHTNYQFFINFLNSLEYINNPLKYKNEHLFINRFQLFKIGTKKSLDSKNKINNNSWVQNKNKEIVTGFFEDDKLTDPGLMIKKIAGLHYTNPSSEEEFFINRKIAELKIHIKEFSMNILHKERKKIESIEDNDINLYLLNILHNEGTSFKEKTQILILYTLITGKNFKKIRKSLIKNSKYLKLSPQAHKDIVDQYKEDPSLKKLLINKDHDGDISDDSFKVENKNEYNESFANEEEDKNVISPQFKFDIEQNHSRSKTFVNKKNVLLIKKQEHKEKENKENNEQKVKTEPKPREFKEFAKNQSKTKNADKADILFIKEKGIIKQEKLEKHKAEEAKQHEEAKKNKEEVKQKEKETNKNGKSTFGIEISTWKSKIEKQAQHKQGWRNANHSENRQKIKQIIEKTKQIKKTQ